MVTLGLQDLQQRLLEAIRRRLASGELTERSMARLAGISQSHMHNVLKGARGLSLAAADTILRRLNLSVWDLLTPEELEGYWRRPNGGRERPPGRSPAPGGRHPAN
ncbi:MAG: helix-turn-helix transcriptional regulator [Acidobacteriota bacterium]